MKHISLFSGIGGFEIAAQWMGWENVAHCEINPFCRQILKYYWPNAKSYEDIKTSDFSIWRGHCDILTMGVPCQPYSTAGKRLGKADKRHMWPYGYRAIKQIKSRIVVFENVYGFVNWNGGLVFDEVQADLEAEGYEIAPFILPAACVGALHNRNRIWIIAIKKDAHGPNADGQRSYREKVYIERNPKFQHQQVCEFGPVVSESIRSGIDASIFPMADGISARLDGITFSKWRKESIKAAGNAIVPQLAYQILKAIEQYELLTTD